MALMQVVFLVQVVLLVQVMFLEHPVLLVQVVFLEHLVLLVQQPLCTLCLTLLPLPPVHDGGRKVHSPAQTGQPDSGIQ